MLVIEFVDLPLQNDLDRRRQRIAVWVRRAAGEPALFLGDVWCSLKTKQWHFTGGPNNLQKSRDGVGFATREAAAVALLADRRQQAEDELRAAVDHVNRLRAAMADDPVSIADPSLCS